METITIETGVLDLTNLTSLNLIAPMPGEQYVLENIIFVNLDRVAVSAEYGFSLGTNGPAFNNYLNSTAWPALSNNCYTLLTSFLNGVPLIASNDVLTLKTTVNAIATSYEAKLILNLIKL